MAVRYAPYEAATKCTKSAGPGARALMAALLAASPGLSNWGIYNCRNTALGNRSAHGEGRALDIGCSVANGKKLVALLRAVGPEKLGISVIIHNRVIMSAKSPDGRRYTGVPHLDHVHVEMTRSAAAKMTPAQIKAVLGGKPALPAQPKPAPKPVPKPAAPTGNEPGSRTISNGSKGEDVGFVQRWLGITDDEIFGDKTEEAVRRYQRKQGLDVDGIVGRATWSRMLRKGK